MTNKRHVSLRAQLRTQLRQTRRALTLSEQQQAALQVSTHLLQQPFIQDAKTVAVYLASDAELDLTPFIEQLWALSKQVVVPVVSTQHAGQMWFAPYRADSVLVNNKFGIAEPQHSANDAVPLLQLDVICVPLVGFDSTGQRIGMGGGFYDRLLAPWYQGQLAHLRPVGIAHNCQHLPVLPAATWDIPLPMVITPSKLWQFSIPAV